MTQTKFDIIDKSAWGDGPWQAEPDEIAWSYGDVACRIVRHPRHGQLNGYVGIPKGHPWYRLEYDDVSAECHGGLTYADEFGVSLQKDDATGEVAVFDSYATRTDKLWWLGFDCTHAFDYVPGMAATMRDCYEVLAGEIPDVWKQYSSIADEDERAWAREVYRDLDYVRAQVEDLARQAIDVMLGRRPALREKEE